MSACAGIVPFMIVWSRVMRKLRDVPTICSRAYALQSSFPLHITAQTLRVHSSSRPVSLAIVRRGAGAMHALPGLLDAARKQHVSSRWLTFKHVDKRNNQPSAVAVSTTKHVAGSRVLFESSWFEYARPCCWSLLWLWLDVA